MAHLCTAGHARVARREDRGGRAVGRRGEAGRRPSRAAARAAVLRHPDDPDPEHAGSRRRTAPGRARSGAALPGHPGVARGCDHPRRSLRETTSWPAGSSSASRGTTSPRFPADANWFAAMSLLGEAIALIGDEKRAPCRLRGAAPVRGDDHRGGARRRLQRPDRPRPWPARDDDGPDGGRRASSGQCGRDRDADGRPARNGALRARPRRDAARPRPVERPRARPGDALDGAQHRA